MVAAGPGRGAGDEADLVADAKRELFDRVLAAAAPGLRDQAEDWLTSLVELAEGEECLGREDRDALAREVLAAADPGAAGAERLYEVAPGSVLTVRARSAAEAAEAAREQGAPAGGRRAEDDADYWYEARAAYSRGPWQRVRERRVAPAAQAETARLTVLANSLDADWMTLGDYVHDLASLPASDINNGGLDAQVAFLARAAGPAEAERMIRRAARTPPQDEPEGYRHHTAAHAESDATGYDPGLE